MKYQTPKIECNSLLVLEHDNLYIKVPQQENHDYQIVKIIWDNLDIESWHELLPGQFNNSD